jgi:hypothetical protein
VLRLLELRILSSLVSARGGQIVGSCIEETPPLDTPDLMLLIL